MKVSNPKILITLLSLSLLYSCKKNEAVETSGFSQRDEVVTSDSTSTEISYAATQNIEGKKFMKSADLNMEVQDVYKSTIKIEKYIKNNGGFITLSALNSEIISDETYNTSNEKAMLVRKYQTENSMEVRIPTVKLADFLEYTNNQKLFLNSRNISAEDITANIHLAKLENARLEKNQGEISKLKRNIAKVKLANENETENNYQKTANFTTDDNLKYSKVKIYIKEPKIRVAEIAITNSKNIDNKYKTNFVYDIKNSLIEGFYLIQKIIIELFSIWPLIIIGVLFFVLYKKHKQKNHPTFRVENKNNS